jgi:hypothetical protein
LFVSRAPKVTLEHLAKKVYKDQEAALDPKVLWETVEDQEQL